MSRPAIFLDRDGTIIEDTDYPRDPNLVKFVPGALEGLRAFQAKGYLLFVISNQSGVGRGIIRDEEFKAVHARVCELLQSEAIEIQEFAYCFHRPEDKCQCRKPETRLAEEMIKAFQLEPKRSLMIGDRESDLLLGDRLGVRSYLVDTGVGRRTRERLGDKFPSNWQYVPDLKAIADELPAALS